MDYDYSKLRGRIVEVCGTIGVFAKKLGLSKTIISLKLNNKVAWSQDDIYDSCLILGIPLERAGEFFLTKKYGTSSL